MNALLSIKPRYADKILSGEKQYEFRKTCFQNPSQVETVLIYATNPVKRITGWFSISQIIEAAPEELWNRFGEKSGIQDRARFMDYFSNVSQGYAFEVDNAEELEHSVNPYEAIEDFHPPVSFYYLDEETERVIH